MSNATNSLTPQTVSLLQHGAVNSRRPVSDKMFESGKRLDCFPKMHEFPLRK